MGRLLSKSRDLATVLAAFIGGFVLCFVALSVYIIKVDMPGLPHHTGAVYGVVSPRLLAGLIAALLVAILQIIRNTRRA